MKKFTTLLMACMLIFGLVPRFALAAEAEQKPASAPSAPAAKEELDDLFADDADDAALDSPAPSTANENLKTSNADLDDDMDLGADDADEDLK